MPRREIDSGKWVRIGGWTVLGLVLISASVLVTYQAIRSLRGSNAGESSAIEASYQDAEEAEKEAGEALETALNNWQRFLDKNPSVPAPIRDRVRQKIDVELPAKIDERDYRRAMQEAANKKFDPQHSRPPLEDYLDLHPQGKHAAEINELLNGGLRRRADDAAYAIAEKQSQVNASNPEAALAALQDYLKRYPEGLHRAEAQVRIGLLLEQAEERAYQKLLAEVKSAGHDSQQISEDCKRFLQQFPKGTHAAEVAKLLAEQATWRVQFLKARLVDSYREGSGAKALTYRPTQTSLFVALVELEFETASAVTGSLQERLAADRPPLAGEAREFMIGEGKVAAQLNSKTTMNKVLLAKPSRLFQSKVIQLCLEDGSKVTPEWTSTPTGFGWNRFKSISWTTTTANTDPEVIRFVRFLGNTAALIQPHRKVRLTLLFDVPNETTKATLRFHDAQPLAVTFAK